MTDKINIQQLLNRMDDEQKASYISMTRENQLLVILALELSNSNRLGIVEKKQIDFEADIRSYRRKREAREDNGNEEVMNTTQKILAAIADADAKRFNVGVWFRDRVLPGIVYVIVIAILYLTFGGKIPTP